MKINKPKVVILDKKVLKSLEEEDVYNCFFEDVNEEVCLDTVTFNSCQFDNLDFSKGDVNKVDLVDVVFNNVDLSNKVFDERLISRVIFNNCKMTGISFIDTHLEDVQFINCKVNYSNFAGAKMKRIAISNSDFSETSFTSVKFNYVVLNEVNFTKAEFFKSPLRDIDFSNSKIDGASFDLFSVKGMIIDSFQFVNLANLLEVTIK